MTRDLSPRQKEILRLAARGFAGKEIAGLLKISEGTVKSHFRIIFYRLGAKSRAHAIYLFFR